MSTIQKNTKIANRYGLNIRICDSNDTSKVYQTIDFANISSLDLSGDTVYARGGARQEKRIGFYDKLVGEFTLSTQILTNDLLCLMTGNTGNWDGESPITFKNRLLEKVRTFTLFGDTVWKDEDGNVYAEEIVLHKVRPRIAYNRSYDGSGDVASVDIVFDLMEDENGLVFSAGKGEELIVVAGTLISPYGVIETGDIWDVNNAGTVENGVLSLTGETEDVDPLAGTWRFPANFTGSVTITKTSSWNANNKIVLVDYDGVTYESTALTTVDYYYHIGNPLCIKRQGSNFTSSDGTVISYDDYTGFDDYVFRGTMHMTEITFAIPPLVAASDGIEYVDLVITSKLADVENGDTLLTFLQAYATKQ